MTNSDNLDLDLDLDFDNLLSQDNIFGEIKTDSNVDPRFFRLSKDEKGSGYAIVRFLPDPDKNLFKQMFRISVNNKETGAWFADWSPATIGMPDPFQEKWSELWNSGKKEEARKFSRQTRYIANIKVINDPKNPDNNGKIFLFDLSQTFKNIIANMISPSKEDRALGVSPKALFNPLRGNNLILKASKGATGFSTVDGSQAQDFLTNIYADDPKDLSAETYEKTKALAIQDIKENCYRLSDFSNPKEYKTYDELKAQLFRVFEEYNPDHKKETKKVVSEVNDVTATTAKPEQAKPIKEEVKDTSDADYLDDLLGSL